MRLTGRPYLLIVLALVAIMLCWNAGSRDVQEWDEARNGVNAFEMYHNHDYINYYYDGKLDTWIAKPPLLIWLIVICYKVFGFNEFALRLPVILGTLIFFYYFFRLVTRYEGERFAFICCLVLCSCKAVLGIHVGLTSDFDGLLLPSLTASVYYFSIFADTGSGKSLMITALCTGIAFYAKGTPAFVLFPGFFLYLALIGRLKLLLSGKTVLAGLLLIAIVGSWILLVFKYGKTEAGSFYGTKNSLEVMLVHDTFRRLTNPGFEPGYKPDRLFFFTVLDTRLNLWNYLFYVAATTGIIRLAKDRKSFKELIAGKEHKLTILSICLILPLALLLTFASHKHGWYLAPIFGFVVVLTMKGVLFLSGKLKMLNVVWLGLLLFTTGRHFLWIESQPKALHRFFQAGNPILKQHDTILITTEASQDLMLYMQWRRLKYRYADPSLIGSMKGYPVYAASKELERLSFEKIACPDENCLVVIR